jgi:hypothetical protein
MKNNYLLRTNCSRRRGINRFWFSIFAWLPALAMRIVIPQKNDTMLRELKDVRQIQGESFRRWFSSNIFDLIVWYSQAHEITGFQLCYREGTDEKALTWFEESGFSHKRVDDGEGRPFRPKMIPILVPNGTFERDYFLHVFQEESKEIDPEVFRVVSSIIKKYPREEG